MTLPSGAARYIGLGRHFVGGWLDAYSARVIAELLDAQTHCGVRGAVGEIGIHHGRLFILLDLMRRADEPAFAIDVFGEQSLNRDRSGRGDEAVFQRHFARFRKPGNLPPAILRRDSTTVTSDDIAAACGGAPVRFLSVDGGHTPEVALSDLRLADACLAPDGIVALDDFANPIFTGVVSALATFLLQEKANLVPFAVTGAKAFLARPARAAQWAAATIERCKTIHDKDETLFGHSVAAFGVYTPYTRLRSRLGPVKRRLLGKDGVTRSTPPVVAGRVDGGPVG